MKYDIYFHNDFDGRACAAVMLAFLRSRGDDIERYVAMTYGKESAWYDEKFFDKGNPAIVVDFTYHPKAAWWFDHHSSTFKKPEWKKRFTSDKQHRLEPKYASCCGLVYASLVRDFDWKPPKHIPAFIKWADMIDGAGYRNARETIAMKDPALQINAIVEGLALTAKEDKLIIELMAELPLAKAMQHPAMAKKFRQVDAAVKKSLAFQKKNLKAFERSTFLDMTKDPLNGLLRYASFYFYPKSNFGIRMRPKGKLWYIGIGVNPWNLPKGKRYIDLGDLMRGFGGGGHKGVGAAEFHSRKRVMEVFEEINEIVNR